MTLDEAIRHCEEVAETNERICDTELSVGLPDIYYHKDEAKKCAEEHYQLAEWLKELKDYRENTCDDAISRQDAIRAIKALQLPIMRSESNYYQFKFSGMSEALDVVENLPSVTPQHSDAEIQKIQEMEQAEIQKAYELGKAEITPQQRTGRWIECVEPDDAEPFIIWECSECHGYQRKQTAFCPNCGTRMEVEE